MAGILTASKQETDTVPNSPLTTDVIAIIRKRQGKCYLCWHESLLLNTI